MVVTKLVGGLGNQMFQYAAGLSLAEKLSTELFMDVSWFDEIDDKDTSRHYELDCFALKQQFVKGGEFRVSQPGWGRKQRLMLSIAKARGKQILTQYREPTFEFNQRFNNLSDNTYLEGYFQSEKYFLGVRKEVVSAFSYIERPSEKNRLLIQRIRSCNSVSIHVRRGDYVTNKHANKFHGLKGVDYYKKAISIMSKQLKQPIFFVFSDDIEWCKTNLPIPKGSTFISHNQSGSEDMRLMRVCKHNIIANSSFSWWGAWLGEYPAKEVIAPKVWFSNESLNTKDVVPNRWQKI